MAETTFSFRCGGDQLVGILHASAAHGRRGVLVVVGGGPQYRVGGHRQLTLWARRLSDHGYPVLRFDYRGMGDSHGQFRGFEHIDDDIRAAVDEFFARVPQLEEVVLWGECDAASAILFYAHSDRRVQGAVLLNPWVRTEAGAARTMLRFYYLQRLLQPSFWTKVFSLRFNFVASAASAIGMWRQARAGSRGGSGTRATANPGMSRDQPLPDRMLAGLRQFPKPLMLVLGGRDLIAREFDVLTSQSPDWLRQLNSPTVTRHDLPEGDHTFSSAAQRDQVVDWGLAWLRNW
jgi:exosortase A-associated hydrolase 1